MAVDTETALAALFALTAPLSQFKTKSRRLQFVEEMGAEVLPAVFQNQIARADSFTQNKLVYSDVDVEWYVYCFQGNSTAATTPILNPLVDALLEALPPDGGMLQVGGRGMPVYRAGPTHYFEGLLGERAVARIGLRIKVLAS